ncbi:MAG: CsgG/HfaB family protein, partial [Chitinispirillales bacterium]|nr:CsgG/HfaB family protein [Chitinispirillales bacterium]
MKKIIPIALLLALGAAAASAQDGPAPAGLPRIAVYVAGGVPDNEKSALGTRMLASLVRSGRYTAIERSNLFLAEVEKEQLKQRSGAVDDSQIRELGKMFGVTYVCIAAITPAFGTFQVSARIVNVETAAVAFIGESYSMLQSADDLKQVSDEVVKSMFGEQAAPPPEPKPEAKAEPAEQQEAPPAEGAKRAKAGKAEPKPRPAVPAPVPAAQPQQKQEAAEQGQSAQQQAGHEQQIEKERLKEELLEQTKPKKLKVGASFSVGG